jgi:hypothetical protein
VRIAGTQQIPEGAHVVELTVHCRWHPEAILYGRGYYDGRVDCYALGPTESHEYIGNYMPTGGERQHLTEAGFDSFAVAKPKPGQPEHWRFNASCTEVDVRDGRERRCTYHVSVAARDSQIVDFVKGLWVRRAPSLKFYNVGPFLEGLGRIGADGWLRVIDELGGVEGFVKAMNRNWNPDSADPPICRIA